MACGKGGRRDDAARAQQAGTTEVAGVGFRAGAERAECGGVLPGAKVVRTAFLLVEESAAGECRGEIPGSEAGGSGSGIRQVGDARVEVLLKNGRSLRVGRGVDAKLVRALVAVVESVA